MLADYTCFFINILIRNIDSILSTAIYANSKCDQQLVDLHRYHSIVIGHHKKNKSNLFT